MARNFNGADQNLALGSATALEITGDISVFFWIKAPAAFEEDIFNCYDRDSPFSGWGLALNHVGSGQLIYWSNGIGSWQTSTAALDNNAWRSTGITISGTGAGAGTFYLDGATNGTWTHSAPGASGQNKAIGSRYDPTNYFTGDLAEIAVWNTALTGAEAAALAKGFSPLFVRPSALVAYWPLIGRTDPEIDVWKNRLAGTLTNAPAAADHPRVIYPAAPLITEAPGAAFNPAWAKGSNIVMGTYQ